MPASAVPATAVAFPCSVRGMIGRHVPTSCCARPLAAVSHASATDHRGGLSPRRRPVWLLRGWLHIHGTTLRFPHPGRFRLAFVQRVGIGVAEPDILAEG